MEHESDMTVAPPAPAPEPALRQAPSRRWRFVVAGIVVLDALAVLVGTFGVWIVLGIVEIDDDVPTWISPTATALGLSTAAITLVVAALTLRRRAPIGLVVVATGLHLGLAVATAVALRSVGGTVVLLVGAAVVWMAGTARVAPVVLAAGVVLGAGLASWDTKSRGTDCNVFAGGPAMASENLTLQRGEQIERCGVLVGMPRSAVRTTLGTGGLDSPLPGDRPEAEYRSLEGVQPGSMSYSSCVLVLDYARGRVERAEVVCKDD